MNVIKKIQTANKYRDPQRLQLKYDKMREDPFAFMRGTCHLFYDRLHQESIFKTAPVTWCCGDLHLENFGSYKGDNRLIYFDINDFDEAALAPCTWEVARILSSILVGAKTYGISTDDSHKLVLHFIQTYAATLNTGKARWVERETASGLVGDLLNSLQNRTRIDFLNSRTQLEKKQRKIKIGQKALPATSEQSALIQQFMHQFAEKQKNPGFFKVLDVAHRIAGTGSLGLPRYIILVEGKGSPDQNYLLDLKIAPSSSIARHLPELQPGWKSEAERIVAVQTRMQAVPMSFLNAVTLNKKSYVLRALQPSEDRIEIAKNRHDLKSLTDAVSTMAQMVAWAQLRSAGQQGSANADALMDYAQRNKWRLRLQETAHTLAKKIVADWHQYCEAYDDDCFSIYKH
jgi:uncharacterized protein (DUF2252 family)